MTLIHERSWACIAGGNGMVRWQAPGLPVQPPVAEGAGISLASPYGDKVLSQPLPSVPEKPYRGE